MSKQRVRADNFEQLIEIVKAVQRGKDPEESLREKEEQELRELLAQEEGEEELPEEERTPEEQQEDERAISRLLRRFRPGDGRDREQPGKNPEEGLSEEDTSEWGNPRGEDFKRENPRGENFKGGNLRGEDFKGGNLRRENSDGGNLKGGNSGRENSEEENPTGTSRGELPRKVPSKKESGSISGKLQEMEKTLQQFLDKWKPSKEKTQNGSIAAEEEQPASREASSAVRKEQSASREDSGAVRKEQPASREASSSDSGFRKQMTLWKEKLAEHGFQSRVLLFAAAGLLLAILLIALIVRSAAHSRAEKAKMEHVTADEGLTVLVEKEPEQWCSSYPVELTVRAQGAEIQRATVNGTSYMLDESGRLTAVVNEPLLEIVVDTEQGSLKAQVEIPKIDAQAPVVNVVRQQDQITVTAGDARSEIAKIRYAVVSANEFTNVPYYQDYSEPLSYEENRIYYFYAQDQAGNRCRPLVSTMEPAESLSLSREEIDLYPEETVYLTAQVEPEGALLNNLKYTSANPEVVIVDSTGKVTAQGVGSTVIKVSADEVKEASCKVTVGESRNVTISALGDCTLGTDEHLNTSTSFDAFDVVHGHSWFFQNVRDILNNDDATFANFEGTLTTGTQRESKEYAFKGDPSYTQILKNASIDVVTLANNHSRDYGDQSLEDTKRYLTEAGIDYCQETEIALKNVNGIPTAFIGIYVLDDGMDSEKELREAIEAAKAEDARLILVAFHWGSEKELQPDAVQQELAHIAVDCGANLVVGHHPHVLQGIEKYKGAYIVYSLGNFCFGGNSAPSDMDTMIFRQTFTVTKDAVLDDDQIEIIPCSISSDAYYNNYQPTPAKDSEAERILGRINEASAPFGMSFTASDGLH